MGIFTELSKLAAGGMAIMALADNRNGTFTLTIKGNGQGQLAEPLTVVAEAHELDEWFESGELVAAAASFAEEHQSLAKVLENAKSLMGQAKTKAISSVTNSGKAASDSGSDDTEGDGDDEDEEGTTPKLANKAGSGQSSTKPASQQKPAPAAGAQVSLF